MNYFMYFLVVFEVDVVVFILLVGSGVRVGVYIDSRLFRVGE